MVRNKILERPENTRWTPMQWRAIHATGSDILVAAGAGSGKTAVLVQRIIEKITSNTNPVDIDRLLVLTFTNAAAAEMRERIGIALEKELAKNPQSIHLRRQFNLLNKAHISTMHAFCIDVIRTHFYQINIDPNFRIADNIEVDLLCDEAIDKVLEEEYSDENNEQFLNVVDSFATDRQDTPLASVMRDLFLNAQKHPNPVFWLKNLADNYCLGNNDGIDKLAVFSLITAEISYKLQETVQMLETAISLLEQIEEKKVVAKLLDQITVERQLLKGIRASVDSDWQKTTTLINEFEFKRAPATQEKLVSAPELLVESKNLRALAKENFQKIVNTYFAQNIDYVKDIRELAPVVKKLSELVFKMRQVFTQLKQAKNILDFSDIEHLALEILTTDGAPSLIAKEYQKHFVEVLVDEYQDTNHVQEALLWRIKSGDESSGNLFMVGDVKQSIYRFRLADPSLFIDKYNRFTSDLESIDSGLKIDLNRNFRSRKNILAGINYLFQRLMCQTIGEVDYDEAACLYYGANYPELENEPAIEMNLVDQLALSESIPDDPNFNSYSSKGRAEARTMAFRIRQLIERGVQIFDEKLGQNRAVTYRDIVILYRSKSWYLECLDEFTKCDIPLYAEMTSGYFETTEITLILSLLQIIDNPYQDIPLVSVLRSPLVGLTTEELASIRLIEKNVAFYDALKVYSKDSVKVARFLELLNDFRSVSKQESVSTLLWYIYRKTNYLEFLGGKKHGKQRQANLLGLYHRANEFEASSFRGIFRFLLFIDKMKERHDDLGEVACIGQKDNVVRMMSVHASKGLEFPFVFLGGLAKEFNKMDLKNKYIIDQKYGFAMKYVDPKKRLIRDTLLINALKQKKELESISEELRVLYVALTRAKERLFLFGTLNDVDKHLKVWARQKNDTSVLVNESQRMSEKTALGWIMAALMEHRSLQCLVNDGFIPSCEVAEKLANHPSKWEFVFHVCGKPDEVLPTNACESTSNAILALSSMESVDITSDFRKKVREQMNWQYQDTPATVIKAKQSVTEIRKLTLADEKSGTDLLVSDVSGKTRRLAAVDDYASGLKNAGKRGTIMHRVMELVPVEIGADFSEIIKKLAELTDKNVFAKEDLKFVNVNQVVEFYTSELGKRLLQAKKVFRELPFAMMVDITKLYSQQDALKSENKVLVQGIIDCLFLTEDDEFVVIDYKTDRIGSDFQTKKSELKKRYQTQLALYCEAIRKSTGKNVSEAFLYFFADGGHIIKL